MKAARLLLVGLIFLAACTSVPTTTGPAATALPVAVVPAATPAGGGEVDRSLLTYDVLMNGFEAAAPVDESAMTMPPNAARATHIFEGRLELVGEREGGRIQMLRGELEPEYAYLPEFDFEFVQSDGYLIPRQRGSIIADHPRWNIILEPGRVWQEAGDGGFSRASFPFALVVKGGNSCFNGTLTFLFDDQSISKVWYQVTQETTSSTRANMWGLVNAVYHPGLVQDAERIRAEFVAELAARLPTKPIQALAEDYPGVDVSAFGRGVTPEHMTWYGVVVNGVNYLGGCQTRFGVYPYCESMRATSFSTAKSAFVSVALMRLAQKYGPEVAGLLIKDYVPESAASPGDWERVTFNHTIDMSAGNYGSAGYMTDEDGSNMGEFFGAQPYAARIAAAFDWPYAAEPGTHWVYHTGDTFILTRALHNYLQSQEGPEADIFQFVVDEVYRPLGVGPGAYTTMRTADDDWQGQAEGGYGLWWIPDDIAKIATLLNNQQGQINDVQVLHPGLLAAALQRAPNDRGVKIDSQRMYNNAFWANRYTQADGFDCEFWVPQMLGVSGNVVALMPNGTTYYYFSDNQEFTWDAAVRELDKTIPLCGSSSTPGNEQEPLPPLQPLTTANAETVVLLRTLQIPEFSTSTTSQCTVAFSPDGRLLSGACYENTLPIWDVQNGQLLFSLEPSPVHDVAVAFSPDGKRIAAGGFSKSIGFWDTATGELIRRTSTLPSPVWDLAFSSEGDRLASANLSVDASRLPGLHLVDASNGELLWSFGEEGKASPRVLSVDYDPTGQTLACGTFDSVIIMDTKTGEAIRTLPISNHVGDLAFSPDGQLLATGSDDHKIRLWKTADYELLSTYAGHTHYVNGVAFSPDGRLLVSGSHDKKVGIWDVQHGRVLKLLEGHEAAVLRVDINPSGTLIASISWDGTVRLWGVAE